MDKFGGTQGQTRTDPVKTAIGGAVGSIVAQGVGIATGMQDKFSWSGVAMGAIGAGVTAGLGGSGAFSGFAKEGIAQSMVAGAALGVLQLAIDKQTQSNFGYAVTHPSEVVDAALDAFDAAPLSEKVTTLFEAAAGGAGVLKLGAKGVRFTSSLVDNYRVGRYLDVTNSEASLFKLGTVFENNGVSAASGQAFEQSQMARRLSVRAFDGNGNLLRGRTVLDAAGTRLDTREFGALEFKLSTNAPLTLRQSQHFPNLEKYGGVVVGNNGRVIGLQPGTVLQPFNPNRINGPVLPGPGDWWKPQ